MFICQQGSSTLITTVCGNHKLGILRHLLVLKQDYRVTP